MLPVAPLADQSSPGLLRASTRGGRQAMGERGVYVAVCERLRDSIRDNEFPDGRLPTERVLGVRHRVSIGTIRKALDLLATEGVIVRRQGSGTYISRPADVRPTSGARRTHMLCYLSGAGTEASTGNFFNRLMVAVQSEVERAGYSTVLAGIQNGKMPMPLVRQKVDGVLVAGTYRRATASGRFSMDDVRDNNDFISRVAALGMPVVTISNPTDCQNVYRIDPDYDQAMRVALTRLQQLGHHRVAVYGGPRAWPAFATRIDAFFRQAALLGLDTSEELVADYENWAWRNRDAVINRVRDHARTVRGVTAGIVISGSPVLVQQGLADAGVRSPDQFSLISFSDIPHAEVGQPVFIDPDTAIGPGTATLTLPIHALARGAINRLVALLEGQRFSPSQRDLRIPLEFTPGTSIQPAPGNSHSGQTGACQ